MEKIKHLLDRADVRWHKYNRGWYVQGMQIEQRHTFSLHGLDDRIAFDTPADAIDDAINKTAVTEPEMALGTSRLFPRPLYWATITVPPVATAIKILRRKALTESTILTALTASRPDELIIEVLNRLVQTMKV